MNKRLRKKKHLRKVIELASHLEEGQALILTERSFLKMGVQTITLPMVTTITQPLEVEGYLTEVTRK